MSIVNSALAFPNCEAPGAAAPDLKPAQDSTGSCETGGFAGKLKDCESKLPDEPQKPGQPKSEPEDKEKDGAEKKDNGMPDDPSSTVVVYGIVGILEGFESPGYQSENTACIGEEKTIPPNLQTAAQNNTAEQTESQSADGATGGLSEQIAWMLQENDTGTKPVQTQDEILQIVGGYLDSLENTNSQKSGTAPEETKTAVSESGAANNGIAPAETTAADVPEGSQKSGAVKTAEGAQAPEKGAMPESVKTPEQAAIPEAAPKAANDAKPTVAQTEEVRPLPAEPESDAAGEKSKDADFTDAGRQGTVNAAGAASGGEAASVSAAADYKATAEAAAQDQVKPETARENVLRIVDRIRTESSEGKYDFNVDLKPDFLGRVSIKLTMKDGSLKVQIKADDMDVKGMLSDQMPNLHTMLKEKGIPVSTIDVAYGGDPTPGREESAGQFDRRNPQGGFAYEQASEGMLESAKERYDFYLGDSNVEYLA